MATHKVYVNTENLSREQLEQLLIDKEQENKKLKEKIDKLVDVKLLLRDIVMDLTKLDELKKIIFKDDANLED